MKYKISYTNPQQHFIDIELTVEVTSNTTKVQLPAWRPGRYELANFAKNIQQWRAYNENDEKLTFNKITKDCWEVETQGVKELTIRYNYFANELNAGSTYLDETQLYVNPINCFLYIEDKQYESCELQLELSEDYQVATGLTHHIPHHFRATDFHELVDSPFIASNSLQHKIFNCNNVNFNLWFQGEAKPDFEKIISDFKKYTKSQIEIFGEFPVDEYHYLFQVLPYAHYHGVEHYNSTVVSLGPTYDLMEKHIYDELLGVSCHELFHTWNIKAIRPKEMYPYNYAKENYSKLGYVAEGVTTYYGDLLLHRSEVFNDAEYFKLFGGQLQKHIDNFARNSYSVAQSSFDTWLDGYVKGVPNRKLSIYSDGCLISFMTDVLIMRYTNNEKSLDDVMSLLYHNFAKKDSGYTDDDYIKLVSNVSGKDFSVFFKDLVYSPADYSIQLKECLDYVGLKIELSASNNYYETHYGFKASLSGQITDVYPKSIAETEGLAVGDVITNINGYQLDKNLAKWSKFFGKEEVKIVVQRKYGRASVCLISAGDKYYNKVTVSKIENQSEEQKTAFKYWKYRS
jgi:predicted metalloprotease with PDZ domain